jgi:hypothetical protein
VVVMKVAVLPMAEAEPNSVSAPLAMMVPVETMLPVFFWRAALETMDTPEARRQWQAWRDAPPNTRTDLPVERRPPSTDEPPALILLRDYFGVMMTAERPS